MERSKLDNLITEKNERIERETLRTAESIIEAIANEQHRMATSQERIVELRKELTDLKVETLDAKTVLGE